jgi:uncharacterized repeat protein (TIGR01451 family)
MHRLTGSSATRLRRYSWLFVPGLIVILLSLFLSIFSGGWSRAHAATRASLENTRETEFLHQRPGSYHTNGLLHLNGTPQQSNSHHLLLPAVVRLLQTNDPKKSSVTTLQQQSAHVFTVKERTTSKGATSKEMVVPTYQPGQTIVYTLAITNDSAAGPVLSSDSITVTDPIPAGLTNITASATPSTDWIISPVGPTSPTTLTATYNGSYPVAAGATLSPITITGTLTSDAIPQVTNTAVVVTPNDSNTDNNSGTNTFNVVPVPDLTVTDPVPTGTTFEVGKLIMYTLTGSDLSTAGPVLGNDPITITDTIPAGLTGITTTASISDWSINLSDTSGPATLTATYIGAYPVNPGMIMPPITITGTLTPAAIPNLANTVTISTPKDTNATNNTDANTIPIVPQPDLSLTKTIPASGSLQVGHSVTYALTASNDPTAGPVLDSDPIIITDTIPAGFKGLTVSANTPTDWTVGLAGTTSPTTMTATYTGTYPIASGATLSTILLTGILTAVANPQVTNEASVSTPNDSNTDNDGASITNPVLLAPDLSLSKTVALAPVEAVRGQSRGKAFHAAIDVKNANQAGPVLADDPITVIDKLPAGITGLVTNVNRKYWHTRIETTKNGTTLIATYVGHYPVARGAKLPSIVLSGLTTERNAAKFTNTVVVTTTYNQNSANRADSKTTSVPQGPQLNLSSSGHLIPRYQGGQQVTYNLTISNSSNAGPVIEGDPIVLVDKIPAGLTNLNATADSTYWQTRLGATTSPTTLTATYVGPYPVLAGARLPAVTLNGILTGATSQLTNTAQVTTPDDTSTAGANNHTGTTTIKVIPAPDLAITKTNFGGHAFYPGQMVQYELHVYSTNASGPINKTVPILVTDALPRGAYHVKAYGTDWKIAIERGTKGRTVVATYTGRYPLTSGTWLPRIIVDARFQGHLRGRRVNTAQVIIPYDSNLDNNTALDTIVIRTPSLPPTGSDPNA